MNPIIDPVDPLAVAATDWIHRGDVAGLRRLLADHPQLATAAVATAGPDWVASWDGHTSLDAARRSRAPHLGAWLTERSAPPRRQPETGLIGRPP